MSDDADVEREAIQAESKGKARTPPKKNVAPPLLRVTGEEHDQRPVIRMVAGEIHLAIEAGIQALLVDQDLFQREGKLVHVSRATRSDQDNTGGDVDVGTPQIHEMAVDTLRERMTRATRWLKYDIRIEQWVRANPTDHIVRGIASRKKWKDIRALAGIIETPSLRPDGTVIGTPGYDAATGFIYIPRWDYPTIHNHPTFEDAKRALAVLEDVFIDFPYNIPAGRSMAVAAVLTLIARPAIRGATPAFLYDANTPGSGKTLQADTASLIALGRDAGRKGFPTDKRGFDEELGKVLCGYALQGARLVNFDNISNESDVPFGGSSLETVLTASDLADFRLLGTNKVHVLPWRAVVMGSGNNIVISRDMVRRVLISRIESPLERPDQRPRSAFKHPERAFRLKEWVRENRMDLVVASLTLLRAHALAGRPGLNRTWASFESWTNVIADAIVWAGGADPLDCRPSEDGEENPEKRALAVVLRDWKRLDPTGQGLTIKTAIGCLYPAERLRGEVGPPDGFEELREAIETLVPAKPRQAPDARTLGDVFRRYKRSVLAGSKLDTTRLDRNGVARWTVVNAAPTAPPSDGLGDQTDV